MIEEATRVFGDRPKIAVGFIGVGYFLDDDTLEKLGHALHAWCAPGSVMAFSSPYETKVLSPEERRAADEISARFRAARMAVYGRPPSASPSCSPLETRGRPPAGAMAGRREPAPQRRLARVLRLDVWNALLALPRGMNSTIAIRADELTPSVLDALRRRALENVNTLSPLRLPEVARRIVDGLIRFSSNGDALAAEEVGRQCATIGLALQSFFAAGRALSQTLSLQGETREDAVARGLLVSDFIGAAVFGIRAVAYETSSAQREKLEQALQEATNREHESLRDVIRELSTPVVPIADRVLLLPLVGAVDMERSSLIMERLLEAIVAHRAEVVLMDVTGVPSIEPDVAVRLFTVARSAP